MSDDIGISVLANGICLPDMHDDIGRKKACLDYKKGFPFSLASLGHIRHVFS